eukprot:GHVN01105443.1.p1 GENE.GHVN01105443.1~~GHVN01105443.1.p1  ORF type:complete len:110 (-),score=6.87 GHVN01105443.1:332-661(-)
MCNYSSQPHFVAVHTAPKLTGRSAEQVRSKYYWRLAVETPRFHNTPRHEPAPLSLDAVSPLRRPLLDQAAVDAFDAHPPPNRHRSHPERARRSREVRKALLRPSRSPIA